MWSHYYYYQRYITQVHRLCVTKAFESEAMTFATTAKYHKEPNATTFDALMESIIRMIVENVDVCTL